MTITMTNEIKSAIIFAAGFSAGVLATYKYFKTKEELRANDEIESVKRAFKKSKEEKTCVDEKKEKEGSKDTKTDSWKQDFEKKSSPYSKAVKKGTYIFHNDEYEPEQKEPEEDETDKKHKVLGKECPYIISGVEFRELYDYSCYSLGWYAAEHVLVDETGERIYEVEDIIGDIDLDDWEHLTDNDSLYVRNDMKKADYEILLRVEPYRGMQDNGFDR